MNERMRRLTSQELDNVAGGLYGAAMLANAGAIMSEHCSTSPATTLVAGAVFYQANQTISVCSMADGDDE